MRRYTVYRSILLLSLLSLFISTPRPSAAVQVPPSTTPFYFNTDGPDPSILADGDWYTSSANGVAAGYHYLTLNIPAGWPSNTSISTAPK